MCPWVCRYVCERHTYDLSCILYNIAHCVCLGPDARPVVVGGYHRVRERLSAVFGAVRCACVQTVDARQSANLKNKNALDKPPSGVLLYGPRYSSTNARSNGTKLCYVFRLTPLPTKLLTLRFSVSCHSGCGKSLIARSAIAASGINTIVSDACGIQFPNLIWILSSSVALYICEKLC